MRERIAFEPLNSSQYKTLTRSYEPLSCGPFRYHVKIIMTYGNGWQFISSCHIQDNALLNKGEKLKWLCLYKSHENVFNSVFYALHA